MNADLKEVMYQATAGDKLSGYFKTEEIRKLWDDHEKHKSDNSYKLFGLTCFSLWLDAAQYF